MALVNLLDHLSLHARVATAALPAWFAVAARFLLGKNRAGWLITACTVWFVINVRMAPYSAAMRQDIRNLVVRLP